MIVSPILIAFGILLVAGAAIDFFQQRIPNWIVLALVALFVVQAARHLHDISWINQLGAAVLLLLAGLGFFALGQLGAGDAKLMAAVALWTGLSAILPSLFLISIAGLVLAGVLVAARRMLPWAKWDPEGKRPKVLAKGGGVPFGVAIASGALVSLTYFPAWLWR
jgi:prepilin peptidase CpaA